MMIGRGLGVVEGEERQRKSRDDLEILIVRGCWW